MERESTLVGADIEGFAGGVARGGGVVLTLVEEGAGLLAAGGVEVKLKAIEAEEGPGGGISGIGREESCRSGRAQLFQLADARVFTLEDRVRMEGIAQSFGHRGAGGVVVECFVTQLDDDEAGVLVDGDAGKLICLAKDETAGIVVGVEKRGAAGDGSLQARAQQIEPGRFAGDQVR